MKNYIMVGAGGTGTHLLTPLTTYLKHFHGPEDWTLYIIDGDVVEEKNLERQLFGPNAITLNKANAAAAANGNPHLQPVAEYLSEANIPKFIQSGDTVFLCVDNFTVRKRIEEHANTLDDIAIINGGNEKTDGSVQLWVRAKGRNMTPRLGYLHPELIVGTTDDRAEMTCQQAAALPGGQQLLVVNMQSAAWMLTALWRFHQGLHKSKTAAPRSWTELQFDVLNGTVEHIDQRMSTHWRKG